MHVIAFNQKLKGTLDRVPAAYNESYMNPCTLHEACSDSDSNRKKVIDTVIDRI
jgi:hypothetical protein